MPPAGGLLYAMGANSYGELGTGDDVERNTSQYIPSPAPAPGVAAPPSPGCISKMRATPPPPGLRSGGSSPAASWNM